MTSRSRLGMFTLVAVSVGLAASLLYFRMAPVPSGSLTFSQINPKTREVVNLHVIVLDTSNKPISWAEVNVTYSCDYITQQGNILTQTTNGTVTFVLDCGLGYSRHLLSLHVTVTAFGYNEYSFNDTAAFYGDTREMTYYAHLTHLPFTQSNITLENFSFCVSTTHSPNSPTVIVVGNVRVHGNMPIVGLHLFINGTDEGTYPPSIITTTTATNGGILNYGIVFVVGFVHPNITITGGGNYAITITATFSDGSTSTASVSLLAKSGSCSFYP